MKTNGKKSSPALAKGQLWRTEQWPHSDRGAWENVGPLQDAKGTAPNAKDPNEPDRQHGGLPENQPGAVGGEQCGRCVTRYLAVYSSLSGLWFGLRDLRIRRFASRLIRETRVFRPKPVTEIPNPPEFVQPAGFATQRPRACLQHCPVPRSLWVPAPSAVLLFTFRYRHPARPPLICLVATVVLPYCSEELPGVPRSNKAVPSQQYRSTWLPHSQQPGRNAAELPGGTAA